MRKIVSEAWLIKEISAHMSEPEWDRSSFWTSVERRKSAGDGPNWRYSFNPGSVPAGFEKRWESIRHKFEDNFNLEEENSKHPG